MKREVRPAEVRRDDQTRGSTLLASGQRVGSSHSARDVGLAGGQAGGPARGASPLRAVRQALPAGVRGARVIRLRLAEPRALAQPRCATWGGLAFTALRKSTEQRANRRSRELGGS